MNQASQSASSSTTSHCDGKLHQVPFLRALMACPNDEHGALIGISRKKAVGDPHRRNRDIDGSLPGTNRSWVLDSESGSLRRLAIEVHRALERCQDFEGWKENVAASSGVRDRRTKRSNELETEPLTPDERVKGTIRKQNSLDLQRRKRLGYPIRSHDSIKQGGYGRYSQYSWRTPQRRSILYPRPLQCLSLATNTDDLNRMICRNTVGVQSRALIDRGGIGTPDQTNGHIFSHDLHNI